MARPTHPMQRLLLAVLLAATLTLPVRAGEKANTVIIHPGEVVYAHFEMKGKKIKLLGFSKEKDAGAQVIFTLQPDEKKTNLMLKVENKFTQDLLYKVEMRSLTKKKKFSMPLTPVVGGKIALETLPIVVEELAAFEFQLEK